MTDRQPYVFEGGTQEDNQREFYLCPPVNAYATNLKVNVDASGLARVADSSQTEEFGDSEYGYDPKFVALESD
jgi:hypothetical protein